MNVYTRYLVRQHLWRILVLTLIIVAIVTPIHVAARVDDAWEAAVEQGRSGARELLLFVLYRGADVLSQVFPISVVLAVLWSEVALSLSGRRLMTQVAGRSLRAGVSALLIVAGFVVASQFVLANFVRPQVVLALIDDEIGTYRQYVGRDRAPHGSWISIGDVIVQAGSVDRHTRAFEDATVYRFADGNNLDSVAVAARLVHAPGAGAYAWRAESGFILPIAKALQPADTPGSGKPGNSTATHFTTLDLALGIDPLWVRYRGIEPIYIPLSDLFRLSRSSGIPADQPDYATALQVRLAKTLNPALLAVLVAVAFFLGSRRRSPVVAAGIGVAAAYIGTIAADAAGVLGQGSFVGGSVGAWASPLVLSLSCMLVLWRLHSVTTGMPGRPLAEGGADRPSTGRQATAPEAERSSGARRLEPVA